MSARYGCGVVSLLDRGELPNVVDIFLHSMALPEYFRRCRVCETMRSSMLNAMRSVAPVAIYSARLSKRLKSGGGAARLELLDLVTAQVCRATNHGSSKWMSGSRSAPETYR
jgi:hypothetical protein